MGAEQSKHKSRSNNAVSVEKSTTNSTSTSSTSTSKNLEYWKFESSGVQWRFPKSLLQCRQLYFIANKTTLNQALTIVFVQKFYMKIVDFCIFEELSKKLFTYLVILNFALYRSPKYMCVIAFINT